MHKSINHSFAQAVIISALFISGCSSDSATPPAAELNISAIGSTVTIDEGGSYNLNISGDNNTVTISKFNRVNTLTLSGSNNLITFESTTSVDFFNISGNDNSIFASDSVTTTVTITSDTGSGNTLTLQ